MNDQLELLEQRGFSMTKEVRDGELNGKVVWICHFNQPDFNKKPLRNIPPTKVLVCDASETKKRIYYSKSYYQGIGKKGLPLKSKVFSPVDNTGYRMRAGNMLCTFDNENDACQCYALQREEHEVRFNKYHSNLKFS